MSVLKKNIIAQNQPLKFPKKTHCIQNQNLMRRKSKMSKKNKFFILKRHNKLMLNLAIKSLNSWYPMNMYRLKLRLTKLTKMNFDVIHSLAI